MRAGKAVQGQPARDTICLSAISLCTGNPS